MRNWFTILTIVLLTAALRAELKVETPEYANMGAQLQGYLVYDDAVADPRPGVLIVHEWWGLTDHTRATARRVAEMGYVVFALDMYGKGVVTDEVPRAAELSGQFKERPTLLRARAAAGLQQLARHPRVDPQRIAAIGFCFGGSTVLQLAYDGAPVRGVISFHGNPVTPLVTDREIAARILVLHGADDPLVPGEALTAFQDAMRARKIDWQLISYGNAVHSFTNPGADKVGIAGVAYDRRTDERAWRHARDFFNELFQELAASAPAPGQP